MLRYTVRERGAEVVVSLEGELVIDDGGVDWTDRLQAFLEEHYVNDGVSAIRLDLADVTDIDSPGIATLIELQRHARQRGKALWIENPSDRVHKRLAVRSVLGRLSRP